ncbi:hypothetical protein SLEP1_g28974 [Rubroshorea leprosula]|uniref:Serine/arginine repetitive matrix protein 1-like n=1 Tax=Rubroshorea leprosula TaxID=152421 RepID=A0AAV5K141_9ROSI|nr:hypothetical protein SLEP1_g28974 [Rubroshorea leprosula]
MGCCISTGGAASDGKAQQFPSVGESFYQKPALENRAPPPSFEEETVKEVLSEVPKPKPPLTVPGEEENKRPQEQKPVVEKIPEEECISFNRMVLKSPTSTNRSAAIEDSVSEDVSEICSLSESISTTTITDRRDEEEEVRQRVYRSPGRLAPRTRNSAPRRDRVVGRSPTKRPNQSPGRRNGVITGGSVRMVQSREPGQATARRGSRPSPTRRDPSESSERRSRSPAVNRSAVGRSPSAKRAIRSPGRVRTEPVKIGNSQKVEENSNLEGKWPSSHDNSTPNSTANESLENPLVSLECFIFL